MISITAGAGGLSIRETATQYTFKDCADRDAFKEALKGCRTRKVAARKSLPEFKGHANAGWSVFVTPWALPDQIEISKLASKHDGRIWGKF